MQLNESVGIITGASSGIGAATAELLGEAGMRLVVTARRAAALDQLTARIGDHAVALPGDIADEALPQQLIDAALDRFGRLDFVFNNAGIMNIGTIEDVDVADMTRMIRVNVEALTRLAYLALKHFKRQGSGYLINTSSILGTKTRATVGPYAGTKYYVEAFTEALRMEVARSGVRVAAIEPGYVQTGLQAHWADEQKQILKQIRRPLQPADIARGVRFMLEQPDHVAVPAMLMTPADQAM